MKLWKMSVTYQQINGFYHEWMAFAVFSCVYLSYVQMRIPLKSYGDVGHSLVSTLEKKLCFSILIISAYDTFCIWFLKGTWKSKVLRLRTFKC